MCVNKEQMGIGCVVAFVLLGMWWAFRHQFFNFPKEKLEGLEWGCAGGGGGGEAAGEVRLTRQSDLERFGKGYPKKILY